jgi:hypothetical protein
MEVDYLVLADAAATAEGKHYIHGAAWDTLYAGSVPVQHPALSVAVRLRVPWGATNQAHRVQLNVVDADGRSILPDPPGPLAGQVNVGRPAHLAPGDDQFLPLTFNIVGLQFGAFGTYSVVFEIDGSEEARSSFKVSALPGLPGGSPPQMLEGNG